MVIQGLKEVCLIDKSVNNHPTQSVNNHNLDSMLRPYLPKNDRFIMLFNTLAIRTQGAITGASR